MKNPLRIFLKSILLLFILSFFFSLKILPQDQHVIDSLKNLVASTKYDTNQVKLLLQIGEQYRNTIPDTTLNYYNRALAVSTNIGSKRFIALCFRRIGILQEDQGLFDKALEGYFNALAIYEEIDDRKSIAKCFNDIAIIHYMQKSFDTAMEYLLKSLKIKEEFNDKIGISNVYNNIAIIEKEKGLYENAIESFQKSLELWEELEDKYGIAICYGNIGIVYYELGDYGQAMEYYLKSVKFYDELGNKDGLAIIYDNISNLNILLSDSVAKNESQRIKYLNEAVKYGNKSIEIAREIKAIHTENIVSGVLKEAYKKLGNYKKALELAEVFIATQDSMFREDKIRVIQEMSARYETEKKQQQIELQESQLIAKDARIQQQKIFRNALIGGLVAVALIIVVIALAYRQKKKDNKKIMEQNEQILEANEELKQLIETTSRQKDEIISSILYAQKIQSAILPPEVYITELLNENFIFYKPKEIVSGDFYWIKQVMNYIILASADCTGHGVPGAFMSMLGISCLNDIVQNRETTQANQILNELRKDIKQSLRQSGKKEESRDGIDIALCVIDKKKNVLQYSGAHNPLYIIRNNNGKSVLEEIKADPMPVGVHFLTDKSFTNHEIKLEIGDTFYIFSDGFVDQIGGNNNHRFKREKFKKLLLDIHNQPMYEQKEILEQTLEDWMGMNPQTDDILVIGARI